MRLIMTFTAIRFVAMLCMVTLRTTHLAMRTGEFSHFLFLGGMTGSAAFLKFFQVYKTGDRRMRIGVTGKAF
jgi:uncharacterized membrane protein